MLILYDNDIGDETYQCLTGVVVMNLASVLIIKLFMLA